MFKRKKNNIETQEAFVSLSYKSITIAYEDNSELIIKSREFAIQSDIDELIKFWNSGIKGLFEEIDFKAHLHILTNSSFFLVKNILHREEMEEKYEYVSRQIDTPRGAFDINKIRDNSYLVIENKDIEKILFAFRDYSVEGFYDLSILNSLYFLTRKNELYLNISLGGVDAIFNGKIFQKRGLKGLFLDYLQKSARRLNLDLDSAYIHIKKSFINIDSYEGLTQSTQNGANELKYFIDDLVEYIKTTLHYFKNYDALQEIDTLYIDGDILELNFIINMIKDRLGLDNIILANDFLKLSNHKAVANTIAYRAEEQMLKSATILLDGLRYSDGKHEYIFVDKSLVVQRKLTKEQRKKVIDFQRIKETKKHIENSQKENKKNNSYQRPNKSVWKMDAGELFELAKNKISGSSTDDGYKEELSIEKDDERGKIIFLILLVLGAITYYSSEYISNIERGFLRTINSYERATKDVEIAKEKLSQNKILYIDDGRNKIIWTEKLMSIANSMPNEIWFTSVRLETKKGSINGEKLSSIKIVLDGRCLPSSLGHINTIAEYMERIMNSDKHFRIDFKDISFGGAESIVDEMGRNLIGFQLYCNFRKNINRKMIEKEKEKEKAKKQESNHE